jgi:hypothetical protein
VEWRSIEHNFYIGSISLNNGNMDDFIKNIPAHPPFFKYEFVFFSVNFSDRKIRFPVLISHK